MDAVWSLLELGVFSAAFSLLFRWARSGDARCGGGGFGLDMTIAMLTGLSVVGFAGCLLALIVTLAGK